MTVIMCTMAGKLQRNGWSCSQLSKLIRSHNLRYYCTKKKGQTHYEVLGLESNCGQAEIKPAFLRLSKMVHPDIKSQGDSNTQHNKFIQLNDAYATLSKPQDRATYDAMLRARLYRKRVNAVETDAPIDRVIFRDTGLWEHRDRSKDGQHSEKNYYGVSWIKKKLPNSYIVAGVLLYMLFGIVLHYKLSRYSADYFERKARERNYNIAQSYNDTRKQAMLLDRASQIEAFKMKMQQGKRSGEVVDQPVP